jgi:hypothetical protein
LPEIGSVNGDPRQHRERLAKFAANEGIALEYSKDIAPARGMSEAAKLRCSPASLRLRNSPR